MKRDAYLSPAAGQKKRVFTKYLELPFSLLPDTDRSFSIHDGNKNPAKYLRIDTEQKATHCKLNRQIIQLSLDVNAKSKEPEGTLLNFKNYRRDSSQNKENHQEHHEFLAIHTDGNYVIDFKQADGTYKREQNNGNYRTNTQMENVRIKFGNKVPKTTRGRNSYIK